MVVCGCCGCCCCCCCCFCCFCVVVDVVDVVVVVVVLFLLQFLAVFGRHCCFLMWVNVDASCGNLISDLGNLMSFTRYTSSK